MASVPEHISNLLTDEYGGRILSCTYNRTMSVQEISEKCSIPIAVAYRRVSDMEKAGLLGCVKIEGNPRGKKVRYYQCSVNLVRYTFIEGKFIVEIEWKNSEKMITSLNLMS